MPRRHFIPLSREEKQLRKTPEDEQRLWGAVTRWERENQQSIQKIKQWNQKKKYSKHKNEASLVSNGIVKESLLRLFRKGCDPVQVLDSLLSHAGYPLELEVLITQEMADTTEDVTKARKVVRHIRKLQDEISELAPSDSFVSDRLRAPLAILRLNRLAFLIEEWLIPLLKWTPPKGMESMHLHEAAQFVRLSTGQPRYQDLAELLSEISGRTHDADVIGVIVRSFQKRRQYHSRTIAATRKKIVAYRRLWAQRRRKPTRQSVPRP
jgi:hypothetical protein